MTLTQDDVKILTRPFAPDDHGAREGRKNRAGDKMLWLCYVEEEPLIERLNEVDPAWTFDIDRVTHEQVKPDGAGGYVSCYATLTIKGVRRSGVGTNTPNSSAAAIGENEEKGAATDALKRCARLFGVGLYLKKLPQTWLPSDLKPWDARPQVIAALRKHLSGTPAPNPPQDSTPGEMHTVFADTLDVDVNAKDQTYVYTTSEDGLKVATTNLSLFTEAGFDEVTEAARKSSKIMLFDGGAILHYVKRTVGQFTFGDIVRVERLQDEAKAS